jgi:hypothetical protein
MPQNCLHPKNGFLQHTPTNDWCVNSVTTPIPTTTYENSYEVDIDVVMAKIPRSAIMIHDAPRGVRLLLAP